MLKRLTFLVFVVAAVLTGGCLQKETSHTLYLSPDGSVAWVTSESGVRSNDAEPGRRVAEEQAYLNNVLLGTHGVARGLAALNPPSLVRTTVLRDQRPFHVVTDADFPAVDRVLERVFTEMGIKTSATLTRGAEESTLRVRLNFSQAIEQDETPVSQLMDNFEHFRIVLTEGRFGAVTGFEVTDDTSATLSAEWLAHAEKAYEMKSSIEFAVTWSVQ